MIVQIDSLQFSRSLLSTELKRLSLNCCQKLNDPHPVLKSWMICILFLMGCRELNFWKLSIPTPPKDNGQRFQDLQFCLRDTVSQDIKKSPEKSISRNFLCIKNFVKSNLRDCALRQDRSLSLECFGWRKWNEDDSKNVIQVRKATNPKF